jgi:hypothetical protein
MEVKQEVVDEGGTRGSKRDDLCPYAVCTTAFYSEFKKGCTNMA